MNLKRWVMLVVLGAAPCVAVAIHAQEKQPSKAGRPVDTAAQSSAFPYEAVSTPWHSQTAQLAQQYVKSETEEQKREIRKKLSDVLSQQFEQHAKQQQRELEDLENQIAMLRATLKKRQEAKTSIIDRRLDQLLQKSAGLGWSA